MSSNKRWFGDFIQLPACSKCDWVQKPSSGFKAAMLHVCPKCGHGIVFAVGQLEFEKDRRWFCIKPKIVGFKPKKW